LGIFLIIGLPNHDKSRERIESASKITLRQNNYEQFLSLLALDYPRKEKSGGMINTLEKKQQLSNKTKKKNNKK
jgi:hypothetical protein